MNAPATMNPARDLNGEGVAVSKFPRLVTYGFSEFLGL